MATAKTTKKSRPTSPENVQETLSAKYREYVLLQGHPPASVFQFMHELKKPEEEFYTYYASFEALEKSIWEAYLTQTQQALHADASYANYSAREKMLAFYYTLLEVWKKDRSYIRYSFDKVKKPEITPSFMQHFKQKFMDYATSVLNEGREQEEIVDRPVLSDRYTDGIWLQMMFLLRFWLRDDSTGFTKTDAAVEKSVNLSFELMGRGPLDQMVDFAKFIYHNR